MKNFLLKHYLREDASYEDYHAIFDIPDENLKKKILDFKIDKSTFSVSFPYGEWKILEYEGEEVKCQSGRDIKYFSKNEVDEILEQKFIIELNQTYRIDHYFKNLFGVVSKIQNISKGIELHKIDMVPFEAIPFEGTPEQFQERMKMFNPTSVDGYFYYYDYSTQGEVGTNISLKYSKFGSNMCIYFRPDGTIFNREYNTDLSSFIREDISPEIILKKFEEIINSLGELKIAENYKVLRFFTDEYVYTPNFYDEKWKFSLELNCIKHKRDNLYQNYPGDEIVKRPSKLKTISPDDVLKLVKNIANEEFFSMFS